MVELKQISVTLTDVMQTLQRVIWQKVSLWKRRLKKLVVEMSGSEADFSHVEGLNADFAKSDLTKSKFVEAVEEAKFVEMSGSEADFGNVDGVMQTLQKWFDRK